MPGKKNSSTLLHVFPKGVREENQEKLAKNLGSCWVADLPPLKWSNSPQSQHASAPTQGLSTHTLALHIVIYT